MDRKEFFRRTLQLGLGCCAGAASEGVALAGEPTAPATLPSRELEAARHDADFVRGWTSDLLDAMDQELPLETRQKLVAACGRGCYRRHAFKPAIAEKGRGDVARLVAAYAEVFECWRDGESVHVRYGETSKRCYCPVVRDRPANPSDLHCECTRATHQSIFEAALGRPVPVEAVETLRRGGKTCHFVARLA